jgi:hypothetical protein
VKSNSVTIELVKKKSKYWTDLKQTKSLTKAAEDIDKKKREDDDENPGNQLMQLMKDLYKDGDDKMKRTIEESW